MMNEQGSCFSRLHHIAKICELILEECRIVNLIGRKKIAEGIEHEDGVNR